MKIVQLISGLRIPLSNAEKQFVEAHQSKIKITGLSEQDLWTAQNLVRKGVYSISKDNITLIKEINETDIY